MDWNDLQYLLALSHHRTLPLAAEVLGVNRTTVSRRIEQLETELGVRLVEKVGRDLALTTAGLEAVSAAEMIEGEVHNLERSVFGRDQELIGEIRITMTQGIGRLLAPELARFQDQFPDIVLDISITNAAEDLDLMESDIALRFTTRPPDRLIGRLVARPTMAFYASNQIAEQFVHLEEVELISTHVTDLIPNPGMVKKFRKVVRTNSIDVAMELVASGRGVTQIPCYMAEGDARLTRVSDTQSDPMSELWLLYHPRMRSQPRIRKFVEFVMATFEDLKPRMEAGS